ncbi:MAG: hypothetical protein PSX71_08830 [bacterium]|nr:hypothetical protein [bacterium]
MKANMTVEEAIDFATEWNRGATFHEGSEGWRVVCMVLAQEIERMREALANRTAEPAVNYCPECGSEQTDTVPRSELDAAKRDADLVPELLRQLEAAEKRIAELEAVAAIGKMLSNVAFNWAQQCGRALTSDDCSALDSVRKEFDRAMLAATQEPKK